MAISRIPVLLAAGGSGWEGSAVRLLSAAPAVALLKRCVDLSDLLATASTGQARVAVVDEALPGLDLDSLERLRRASVVSVLVHSSDGRTEEQRRSLGRLGADRLLPDTELASLSETVVSAASRDAPDEAGPPSTEPAPAGPAHGTAGRLLAVWGPNGAPGRTTVAVNLAAELALRHPPVLLLDADGHGGAVAQHLGILDETSGLLGAARLANTGQLDPERLAGLTREVAPGLRVLTGLPRADRWQEVRESAFQRLLELSRTLGTHVVVDTSFALESDPFSGMPGVGTQRHAMTLASLRTADEVLAVGAADPVGLSRLARGLVDLEELDHGPVRVVVNRTRAALGWGDQQIRGMVEEFARPTGVHFLPEDRLAADRALVTGRSLVELGDSPLRRAITEVAGAVAGQHGRRRGHRRARLFRR